MPGPAGKEATATGEAIVTPQASISPHLPALLGPDNHLHTYRELLQGRVAQRYLIFFLFTKKALRKEEMAEVTSVWSPPTKAPSRNTPLSEAWWLLSLPVEKLVQISTCCTPHCSLAASASPTTPAAPQRKGIGPFNPRLPGTSTF